MSPEELKALYKEYQGGASCEVTINCDGKFLKVHKAVIAQSEYFVKMMNDARKGLKNHIKWQWDPHTVIEGLLEFLYTGYFKDSLLKIVPAETSLYEEFYLQLYEAGKRYEITNLPGLAVKYSANEYTKFEDLETYKTFLYGIPKEETTPDTDDELLQAIIKIMAGFIPYVPAWEERDLSLRATRRKVMIHLPKFSAGVAKNLLSQPENLCQHCSGKDEKDIACTRCKVLMQICKDYA